MNAGELLAVKRIHFDNITRDELAAIEQEILLLQKLRHEHIVSYMAIDITDTNLNILMEFCPGGSVAHLLKAFGALEEDVLRAYTRQVNNIRLPCLCLQASTAMRCGVVIDARGFWCVVAAGVLGLVVPVAPLHLPLVLVGRLRPFLLESLLLLLLLLAGRLAACSQ